MAKSDMNRNALAEQMADVLAYRGTDMYAQFVQLLNCIEDCYRDDLLSVAEANLRYKQGAAAQVRILRDLLIDRDSASFNDLPKV